MSGDSKKKMVLVTVVLPEKIAKDLDMLVFQNDYANRSEAVREAIKSLIDDEQWLKEKLTGIPSKYMG